MRFVLSFEQMAGDPPAPGKPPAVTGWKLTTAGLDDGAPVEDRTLIRGANGFPLPPGPIPGNALWTDPDDLLEVYESIAIGRSREGHVPRFGHYLFEVLLGGATWDRMLAKAAGEPIELALRHARDDRAIARLPWEMMLDPRAAGGKGRHLAELRVAVERLAAPDDTTPLDPLRIPLRVLFVVGASPEDATIRAGTEYLGLLRRLRETGPVLVHDIVLDATRTSLRDAVLRFRPSIVHFIGHGAPGHVELTPEKSLSPSGAGAGKPPPDTCRAADFVEAIRLRDGSLPAIVVLNACDGAGQPISLHVASTKKDAAGEPMALGLVERGVRMVIGMAGRIADHACRLFTRRFYETLLDAQQEGARAVNVALAAAEGRAAAFIQLDGRQTSVDWVYPTLTVDARLPSAEIALADVDGARWRAAAAKRFRKKEPFCDRFDLFSRFGRWLGARPEGVADPAAGEAPPEHPRTVLALVENAALPEPVPGGEGADLFPRGRARFGMTRALEELALHAANEGFLPCLVSLHESAHPKTFPELGAAILDEIEETCRVFKLPPFDRDASQYEAVRERRKGRPTAAALHRDVERKLDGRPEPEAEIVALQLDLAALAGSLWKDGRHRLLLMIDDVHDLTAGVQTLGAWLRSDIGAGRTGAPVPVVMACRLPAEKGVVRDALDRFLSNDWVEQHPLTSFATERSLAYQQVLLYGNKPPRAFADRDPEAQRRADEFYQEVHTFVAGVPSWLEDDRVRIEILKKGFRDILVDASDDAFMEALRKARTATGGLAPGGGGQ